MFTNLVAILRCWQHTYTILDAGTLPPVPTAMTRERERWPDQKLSVDPRRLWNFLEWIGAVTCPDRE